MGSLSARRDERIRGRWLERLARRIVPSIPVLSHRRILMALLDGLDALTSLPFSEFRGLPPNRLRIRVGVGNRILLNQPYFLEYGYRTWIAILAHGLASNRSSIVDIGCGCGRVALALQKGGFAGCYTGVDVDEEMIRWCREHLPRERFVFHHCPTYSRVYQPQGSGQPYRLPIPDGSQDLVYSQSLFTHLLEGEVRDYIAESQRVLRPGGVMSMGVFCLDDLEAAGRLNGRWTFDHVLGNSRLQSLEYPEAAVAYQRPVLEEFAREAGFATAHVLPDDPQSVLFCRR